MRDVDSEYKLFEYAATVAKDGKHHTIEILSEKAMCDSCIDVMKEFERKYPNVEINIVSYKAEKAKHNFNHNSFFENEVKEHKNENN